jgi:hypothetical protein
MAPNRSLDRFIRRHGDGPDLFLIFSLKLGWFDRIIKFQVVSLGIPDDEERK